tara:strand:- start:4602 stop:5354 length:753 start_codon:yes stop_codon:yes gene_type:complete
MIILKLKFLLNEILYSLFDNNNTQVLILRNNLTDIYYNFYKLNKDFHNELLVCKKIPTCNDDLTIHLIKTYYQNINRQIRKKQKSYKINCLSEIRNSLSTFYFKKPITIFNNKFYKDLIKEYQDLINIAKFSFLIDDNTIIGINNLDNENTTLIQFLYFCKIIQKFLNNTIKNFVIYPHEIVTLFRKTSVSSFRSLYLLYEARNDFFTKNQGKKIPYNFYIKHMIDFMNKKGHTVRTLRNNNNSIVFLHV